MPFQGVHTAEWKQRYRCVAVVRIQQRGTWVQREEHFKSGLGVGARGRFNVADAAFEVSLEGLGFIPLWVPQEAD